MDHLELIKDAKAKNFKPIYLLHGEEPLFIDLVSEALVENALEEHERDFNLTTAYGKDALAVQLINEAKAYPTMAERRVVILREAQSFGEIADLEPYFSKPNPQTVFILCYKYKTLDARSAVFKAIKSNGIVFKSEKIKDYKMLDFIKRMAKDLGYSLSEKAAIMLYEFLGTDLSKIQGELEKLSLLVEKGSQINEVHVEENIGISKDYNLFELTNAIAERDVPKAFQIVHYFEANPKNGPLVAVVGNLFNFFASLMRMHFLKGVSDGEIAKKIGMHPYVVGKYKNYLRVYNPKKISANIATLHEYDLKSKGIDNSHFTEGELMRELVFKLMN